ncbi:MAG: hypothetical protein AAFR67_00025 [Chloroflexota bacterium]
MSQQDNVDRVYSYIKERLDDKQRSPTQREIAEHCTLSTATVGRVLSILEAQGRITRTAYKSRSIRLAEQAASHVQNQQADAIYDYLQKVMQWGDSPSQQEIAEACLLSRAEVRAALLWLEAQGRIERGAGQRNIQLVEA